MTATSPRAGLRVISRRAHADVALAMRTFAAWLRGVYAFPVRLPVYLSATSSFAREDGQVASTFFAPDDPAHEPFIRIATGDYQEDRDNVGRSAALVGYLESLALQVLRYQAWREGEWPDTEALESPARSLVVRYLGSGFDPVFRELPLQVDEGADVLRGPATEALSSVESRARDGDLDAMYDLGARYATGLAAPIDQQRAYLWYLRAALQGDAGAVAAVAHRSASGLGTTEDDAVAEVWYERAEQLGVATTNANLFRLRQEHSRAAGSRIPEAQLRSRAKSLCASGVVTSFSTVARPDDPVPGVVVSANKAMVVLQQLGDAYEMDGFTAVPWPKLVSLDAHQDAAAIARVLASRGERPATPALCADSVDALVGALLSTQELVILRSDTNDFYLGAVRDVAVPGQLRIARVAADGTPDDVRWLTLRDVALVSWGSRYLEAITLMAQHQR